MILSTLVALAVVVLAVALAVQSYRQSRDDLVASYGEEQLARARWLARALSEYLSQVEGSLELVASLSQMAEADEDRCMEDLALLHSALGRAPEALVLLRPETAPLVYPPSRQGLALDFLARAGVPAQPESTGASYSEVLEYASDDLALAIWTPLPGRQSGRGVGTLAAIVGMRGLSNRYVSRVGIGMEGYAFLVSDRGVIICDPRAPSLVGKAVWQVVDGGRFPSAIETLKRAVAGEEGRARYTIDFHGERRFPHGIEKIAAFSPVAYDGGRVWSAIVTTPLAEVTAMVVRGQRSTWLLAGVVVLMLTLTAYNLIRVGQAQARARERARAEALSEVVVTLSHEVNNPLEAILNQVRLLSARLGQESLRRAFREAGLLPEYRAGREALDAIAREARRIGRIIARLRQLALEGRAPTTEYLGGVQMIKLEGEEEGEGGLPEGLRVLVVDDNEEVLRSLSDLLEEARCKVTKARSGEEAVAKAAADHFDLVITDIRMPDKNGYQVFSEVRKLYPDMPFVMMTAFGYDESHSIVKARKEGLCTTLFKPFDFEQLRRAILDLLEARSREH